jgi:hypothetical protein
MATSAAQGMSAIAAAIFAAAAASIVSLAVCAGTASVAVIIEIIKRQWSTSLASRESMAGS